jgi:outer membrane protein assembly factor BamB
VVSTPTVAGGVVFYGDGTGDTVKAFDERTGTLLWSSRRALHGPIFAAPVVADRFLYAVCWDHRLHAFEI